MIRNITIMFGIYFVCTKLLLFVSVFPFEVYKIPRSILKEYIHNFPKQFNYLKLNNALNYKKQIDHDKYDDSLEIERNYEELLEQLRFILTVTLEDMDKSQAKDIKIYKEQKNWNPRRNSNDNTYVNSSNSSEEISDQNMNFRDEYDNCERGRRKCLKACKSAYREACYLEGCPEVRGLLRKRCKRSCRRWFS